VLIGDGCMSHSCIHLSNPEEEICKYVFNNLPEDTTFVKIPDNSCDYRFKRISRNNKRCSLVDYLEEYSLLYCKSNNKFIPKIYLYSSVEDRIMMLQGLLDTDGTLDYKSGKNVSFCTVSEELKNNIIELVQSLGGIATTRSRIPNYTYKGEKRVGQLAYNVSIKLPAEISPFKYCTRKRESFKHLTKYIPVRYIDDVVFDGEEEATCIFVDSPTHLYITRNYIVTHNTLLAVYAGLDMINSGEMERIVIVRAMVGTEEMGFLPGDIDQKMGPWVSPLLENMHMVTDKKTINTLLANDTITILPLAFARGHTYKNTCMIIDESQNMTSHQLEMVLTRLGIGSKVIICGDTDQIDLKRKTDSSLFFFDKLIMDGIEHVTLITNHRHSIVADLITNIAKLRTSLKKQTE
jgi:hypothetical protein